MKGFIGPIGDDLPSLIAVMLALTLFFSGLTFSVNTFTQRREKARVMKGALDISRAILKPSPHPRESEDLKTNESIAVADSNGLAFNAGYLEDDIGNIEAHGSSIEGCSDNSLTFTYLVNTEDSSDELKTLKICVWEAEE